MLKKKSGSLGTKLVGVHYIRKERGVAILLAPDAFNVLTDGYLPVPVSKLVYLKVITLLR